MPDWTPQQVELFTTIIWWLFALIVVLIFYRPIRDHVFPRLSSFSAMGVEFSLVRDSINAAIETANKRDIKLAEKSTKWNVEVPEENKELVVDRAKRNASILRGVQILWVDDCPENNKNELKMFRQLQIDVRTVTDTQSAVQLLQEHSDQHPYDIVLSDMARGDEPSAGLSLLAELANMNVQPPVIFYVGVIDPTKGVPPQAFGLTNRPDELLHLVIDALERVKR